MGSRLGWRGMVGLGGLLATFAPWSAQATEHEGEDWRPSSGYSLKKDKRHRRHHEEAAMGGSGLAAMYPRLGGHVGFALPVLNITDDDTTVIGGDFFALGLTPGISVKLTEQWTLDFEFIAFSRWDFEKDGEPERVGTSFVVDPGLLYNFGGFTAGVRLAMQVGAGQPFNLGVVPIVVKPFPITEHLKWFLELDLPLFFTGAPGDSGISFGPQIQTGIAF
ncbi:hypothetical protein [Myxococcus faecalis]|uniref:hypothetical protein n=1 Tax=Myxococcus faecalis TaxID=3115646 RepID=UPI003CF67A80